MTASPAFAVGRRRHPMGKCPHCGGDFATRGDGSIWRHRVLVQEAGIYKHVVCPGSGTGGKA